MWSVQIQFFFVFIGAVLLPQGGFAHGALDERIIELSAQIKTNGTNGELYFQRGELHRQHGAWELVLKDFDLAEKRDPKITQLDFARGRTFFAANKFNEAKAVLDKFISVTPNPAEALAMRARTLAKLGQPAAASEDFTRAINCSTVPDPDYFLQRADAQVAFGKSHEALAGLDEAINKIGPIISLQIRAIELETNSKNFASALKRLDILLAQSPRKETWLMRRGEILEKAGNRNEARLAFSEALMALEAMSANRRRVPAMTDLEDRVRLALRRIESSSVARTTNEKQP